MSIEEYFESQPVIAYLLKNSPDLKLDMAELSQSDENSDQKNEIIGQFSYQIILIFKLL